MGTSLTGLTPSTTYDALIKVGDNGALSATAKVLSDGLGNDSILSLSTSKVGIGTNTPNQPLTIGATNGYPVIDFENSNTAYGDIGFQVDKMVISAYSSTPLTLWTNSNERLRITDAGNVGIGTATPDQLLQVAGNISLGRFNVASSRYVGLTNGGGGFGDSSGSHIEFTSISSTNGINFFTYNGVTYSEKMRITGDGYLRLSTNSGGIQFGGDTAAANALDDYEEGTWTMGVSFGGGSTGITYSANTGGYTKIGRQVTATGYLQLSSKGSSTGDARITGLPFTINNSDAATSTAGIRFNLVTFANQFQGWGQANTTTINLEEITILGVVSALTDADFANNSQIMISLTYFV